MFHRKQQQEFILVTRLAQHALALLLLSHLLIIQDYSCFGFAFVYKGIRQYLSLPATRLYHYRLHREKGEIRGQEETPDPRSTFQNNVRFKKLRKYSVFE